MNDELSMINADNNTIPDSCLSYSEQALYVSEKMRENYNEALKYIGAFELAIYEATNNQLQYNSGKSINMLQNKLTDIYESDFATMKGFWTGVVADINEAVMNSRSYDLMLVEESDVTKSSYGTTHTFFDPEKVKFYANADKVINIINTKMSKLVNADQNAIDVVKAELEKRICSSISGVQGASNVKEMKETLKEKLVGKTIEADDKFVKKNLDKMKSIVTGKSSIKIAKNAYKSEKAAIKSAISAAKKAGASNQRVVKVWHSLLTDVLSVLHACYAAQLDVHKRQYHEYKNILVKCKKAGICESTYISSEDIEMLDEASFTWLPRFKQFNLYKKYEGTAKDAEAFLKSKDVDPDTDINRGLRLITKLLSFLNDVVLVVNTGKSVHDEIKQNGLSSVLNPFIWLGCVIGYCIASIAQRLIGWGLDSVSEKQLQSELNKTLDALEKLEKRTTDSADLERIASYKEKVKKAIANLKEDIADSKKRK